MATADAAERARWLRLGTFLTAIAAVLMLISAVLSGSRFSYLAAAMLAVSASVNWWALDRTQRG